MENRSMETSHISSLETMEKMVLYDALGSEIHTFELNDAQQYDVQMAAGLYTLQIFLVNGNNETHKIICY